jgi:hypothetical protein
VSTAFSTIPALLFGVCDAALFIAVALFRRILPLANFPISGATGLL